MLPAARALRSHSGGNLDSLACRPVPERPQWRCHRFMGPLVIIFAFAKPFLKTLQQVLPVLQGLGFREHLKLVMEI